MRKKTRSVSAILAMQGSGKTALMQYLLMCNPKSSIIFDPTGSLEPFKNRVFIDYETMSVAKAINKIGRKNLYNQKIDIVIQRCDDIESVLKLIYNNLENICIVIDEIDLCYTANLPNHTYLYKICNFGRHKRLDLIGVARRPANMPRALTSQSNYLYLGNSNQEPLDMKYIKSFVDSTTFKKYQNLQNYYFLRYDSQKHSSECFKLPKIALKMLNIQ